MKVSIITSFYNDIHNFDRTYRSIKYLKEKFSIEYLLIDGGSDPKVKSDLTKYLDIVDVFVSEHDRGVYDGINKGMLLATGDYIGICNAGDEIWIDGFEKYYGLMSATDGFDVITGSVWMIDKQTNVRSIFRSRFNNLFFGLNFPHMSLYIEKSVIGKIGVYDLKFKLSSDYDYAKRLYTEDLIIANTNIVIGAFYKGGRSGGLTTYLENYKINRKHERSVLVSILILFACVLNSCIRRI
jgi:glycosyltransferase involved in cell wall biosynthesis